MFLYFTLDSDSRRQVLALQQVISRYEHLVAILLEERKQKKDQEQVLKPDTLSNPNREYDQLHNEYKKLYNDYVQAIETMREASKIMSEDKTDEYINYLESELEQSRFK